MKKDTPFKNLEDACARCGGRCCRYVATEIDRPTCKRDYDNIRWYLLHKRVNVFVDHDGDWYIEFETPCEELDVTGRCGNYENRPRLCRHHGENGETCEFISGESPYRIRFQTAADFETHLDRKGIRWRFKHLE